MLTIEAVFFFCKLWFYLIFVEIKCVHITSLLHILYIIVNNNGTFTKNKRAIIILNFNVGVQKKHIALDIYIIFWLYK